MERDQLQGKTTGGFGEEEQESMGGISMRPPAFQLAASGGGNNPIQRQEVEGGEQAEGAQQPQALQVPDNYRDPLANSNLSLPNIRAIIAQWEAKDEHDDDRKLAYILATSYHESGHTMNAIHEGFDDNYWPSRYADTGYWGRGFVQLTWEDNYRGMEDETGVDLTQYPEAALLPQISAIVTVDGMMDGDFRRQAGPLNNYIPVTENEDGSVTRGQADYEGARDTVNGGGDRAGDIAAIAQTIETAITTYRAGVTAGTITKDLASYLIEDTTVFNSAKAPDAQRLLVATGHLNNFGAPGFGDDRTAQQERYQGDVRQTGYLSFLRALNTPAEIAALTAFQQEFNRDHNLDTPLPENGRLDERTLHALTRAGQIQSGNNMIDYAFHGEVQAINPVTQAWERQQAGEITLPQLAATLVSLMPVPNANDVIGMLDSPVGIGTELAFQLSANAPTHNDLAYFNRAILTRMQALLTASTNPRHQAMATRLADLAGYAPPRPAHSSYTVVRGDSMGAIARRLGMTVDALIEYNNANGNPIRNANSISVGQQILYPNPDGATQGEATPTAELSRYDIPAEAPPVTDTSSTATEPQTTSEGVTPDTSQKEGDSTEGEAPKAESLSQKFLQWLSSLWGGGQ